MANQQNSSTTGNTQATYVRVWDPFVRAFHWSLVLTFCVAYLSGDNIRSLHVYAGYVIGGLIALRIVWGIIGPRHARFTDFVHRPKVVADYVKSVAYGSARRYLGHNPAGGAMIVTLLVMLAVTIVFGALTYATVKNPGGPFLVLLQGSPRWLGKLFKEVHEVFANGTLALVLVHITGVVVESLLHEENLVRAMITGMKRA